MTRLSRLVSISCVVSATGGQPAVNARDRIGRGPWYNAEGTLVATDVEDLHRNNTFGKELAVSSWNSAHASRGCSQPDLVGTGGAGLFYCFAID